MNHRLFIVFSCLLGTSYMLYALLQHRLQVAIDTQAHTQTVFHLRIVSPYEVEVPDGTGSVGGGGLIVRDNCPYGDFSPSYYDGRCTRTDRDLYPIDDDLHYIAPIPQGPGGMIEQGRWLRYRDIAHIIRGVLIKYHPDVSTLVESQRISGMHEGIVRIVKLYNIPLKIDLYGGNTLITQRDFIYFVILLRHIAQRQVIVNDRIYQDIAKLRGYISYPQALSLIQKYGLY